MKAAIVRSFDNPPQYGDIDAPSAQSGEIRVHTRAAALSQLVRAQASGKHYSSGKTLPIVPGADGVGVLPDGKRVYFAFPRAPIGAMAEQVAVAADRCVPLPDAVDDITAAAIANPGMSSWAALEERAHFQRGEAVLINGASGTSGKLAIQIARHLGAGRIIVTARNPAIEDELRKLGADVFIPLQQNPEQLLDAFRQQVAAGLDVVLDYLWGPAAESLIAAIAGHGMQPQARPVRFVNIGSLAGLDITLPAGCLRSSQLELLGSGLGSVSPARLVQVVGKVLAAVVPAGLRIDVDAVPLTDVESAWSRKDGDRIVFTL